MHTRREMRYVDDEVQTNDTLGKSPVALSLFRPRAVCDARRVLK